MSVPAFLKRSSRAHNARVWRACSGMGTRVGVRAQGHARVAVLAVVGIGLLTGLAFNFTQPAQTAAATSNVINFQARLENAAGAIVPDGNYNIEFKLYNASGGGSALWTEDYLNGAGRGVEVSNGYVTVNLGSVTAFPSTINWDQQLWLTMNIGGISTSVGSSATDPGSWDGEMNPRLQLTALPYAFQSNSAHQLQQTQGSYVGTLSFGSLTANRSVSLPNENGTLCIQNSDACGFAKTSDLSNDYIQLQGSTPGTQQTGSFNISANGILGGTLSVGGNLTANGSALFKNSSDSPTAFRIQNSFSTSLLSVDTSSDIVQVGSATANANGINLVLNNYSGATDPTGTEGAMYYNTSMKQFRCYQNGGWVNCAGEGGNGVNTVGTLNSQVKSANGAVIAGSNIYLQTADATHPGLVSTGAQTFAGDKTFASDSATAFQIQSAGSSKLFTADTSDMRVAINEVGTPNYTLDVGGDINTTGVYRINGTTELQAVGSNLFLGGASNTSLTGTSNYAIGQYALGNDTTGNNNFAVGYGALAANTTGTNNISIGGLGTNQDGDNNIAIGGSALNDNVSGNQNIAVGGSALLQSTGYYNVALGYQAGDNLASGDNNVLLGASAGGNLTGGSGNIIIGTNINAQSATGSNQLNIGNAIYGDLSTGAITLQNSTDSATALQVQTAGATPVTVLDADTTNGRVGVGTAAPAYTLDVQGGTGIVGQFSGRVIGADAVNNDEFTTLGQVSTLISDSSGNYILNQTGLQASSNFHISGTGTADTSLSTPLVTSSGALLVTGGTTLSLQSTGTSAVSLDSGTTGAVNVGVGANAKTVTIGTTTTTATTTIQAGSGGINLSPSGASNTGVLIKPGTDSATAFQIQNAATGTPLFTADTSANRLAVGPAAVPANGVLTVGTDTLTASGGIYFGTDTNLYRGASDTLMTDDALTVGQDLLVQGNQITFGAGPTLIASNSTNPNSLQLQGGFFFVVGSASTQEAYCSAINTDPYCRLQINTDGLIQWGSGTSAADTNLYRGAIGQLKTDSSLLIKSIGGSAAAFQVQNGSGVNVLNVDTSTTSGSRQGILSVGTSNISATLFVLDTKTSSGDPTGQNGAMYYNSNTSTFRCYQGGAWTNCVGGTPPTLQSAYTGGNHINLTAATPIIITGSSGDSGINLTVASGNTPFVNWDNGIQKFGIRSDSNALHIGEWTGSSFYDNLSVGNDGTILLQNSTDSTTAFQVQNALGTKSFLTVDTTGNGALVIPQSTQIKLGTNASISENASTNLVIAETSGGTTIQSQYLKLQDNYHSYATEFAIQNGGQALFQNAVDSSTAFQIQDAGNNSILNVDTSSGQTNFLGGGRYVATFNNNADTSSTGSAAVEFQSGRSETGYDGNWQSAYLLGGTGKGLYLGVNNNSTTPALYIDPTGASTFASDSATALKVQDTSGNSILNVNTAGGQVELGDSGSTDGTMVFKTSAGSNTVSLSLAGEPNNSYTLLLPTSAPAGGQCLKTGLANPSQLVFGSCITPTTPQFVQQATNSSSGTVTSLATSISSSSAGDLLIAQIGVDTGSAVVTSVTDSAGNTWSKATSGAGGSYDSEIWYAVDASPATQVTVHTSSSHHIAVNISEFDGVAQSNILDVASGHYDGGGNTHTTPSITTNVDHDLVLASLAWQPGPSMSGTGAGWNDMTAVTATPNMSSRFMVGSPAGAFSTSWTSSFYTTSSSAIVAFKPAGDGSDYAEDYGTTDSSIAAGDVVALDLSKPAMQAINKYGQIDSKAWVVKASSDDASDAIGVVSTSPGQVIGKAIFSTGDNPRSVALSGRVPVKVSDENGPIEPGDYLVPSSTPGVAMKAISPGMTIGQALSGFSGPGQGTVTAFVKNTYYPGGTASSGGGYLQNGGNATLGNLTVNGQSTVADLQSTGTITAGTLTATTTTTASMTATNTTTDALSVGGNATVGNLTVNGTVSANDLRLNGSAAIGGNLKVGGSALFRNTADSTSAFQIQSSGSTPLFTADTQNSRVYVGNPTPDSVGALLVLDTKNNSGDPTGVNGGMYYNSATGKFRCYQDGSWRDCLSPWVQITKSKDQDVTNSSTYADDDELHFDVSASKVYTVRFNVCYAGNSNAADYKGEFTFPGAISAKNVSGRYVGTGTGDDAVSSAGTLGGASSFPNNGLSMGTADSFGDKRVFEGDFTFQPNADGTVHYRFAQNAATADTTARTCANSFIEYQAL